MSYSGCLAVTSWLKAWGTRERERGGREEGEGRERERKWEEGNRMLVYERKGIMCMRTHAHTHTHTPYVLQSVAAVR